MFDKEAIKALQYGGGIREASNALVEAYTSTEVVSLPDHFTIHDLERFMPNRRRARGSDRNRRGHRGLDGRGCRRRSGRFNRRRGGRCRGRRGALGHSDLA